MTELVANMIGIDKAAAICGINGDDMRQWTDSGHAPHYMVNGKGPYYKTTEIREWAKENFIVKKGGFPVPRTIDVLRPVIVLGDDRSPPISISAMHGLCHIALTGNVSGIYFLCDGNEVVYVGQSTCVIARLGQHIAEGAKVFDHSRVFFLPCPIASLNTVEKHFIDTIKPKYNGGVFSPHRLAERQAS